MGSRVPVTLSMDGTETIFKVEHAIDTTVSGTARVQHAIDTTVTGTYRVEHVIEPIQMADSSTAFFKIGVNTVNSSARDGLFSVDGEQLAKPGA